MRVTSFLFRHPKQAQQDRSQCHRASQDCRHSQREEGKGTRLCLSRGSRRGRGQRSSIQLRDLLDLDGAGGAEEGSARCEEKETRAPVDAAATRAGSQVFILFFDFLNGLEYRDGRGRLTHNLVRGTPKKHGLQRGEPPMYAAGEGPTQLARPPLSTVTPKRGRWEYKLRETTNIPVALCG